jgi:DNA primase
MITDDKKEDVRAAADLVEVVGDYVKLKRSGSGYVGLCPFHDEKTPSFNVTPRLGIYKCFGCGKSGDVFGFVMEMEGVGFGEAMRTLAERYGVDLPDEQTPVEDDNYKLREGVFHALRFAGLWFYRQLKESDEAEKARNYLHERGYERELIKKFGLGYSPSGNNLLLKAAREEGISDEYLAEADLIKPSQRDDDFYDTFRGRLMFPIFNPSGKVIAFAGRVLGNEKTAKYINSAQTMVYNKSEVVYGANFAKNEIRKHEEVILVEGYTDVITLNKFEIENVVASSGTALTAQQIRLLKRYGNKIVMIYDADNAGKSAMARGMNIALEEGMDVDLLELPDGEDPDSFVKQFGKESFLKLKKKEGRDFVTFSILQAEKNGMMENPAGRAKVISGVLSSISRIPEKIRQQVFVQHLHQLTQKYRKGSDRELFEELERITRKKTTTENRRESFRERQEVNRMMEEPAKPKAESRKKIRPGYEMEIIRLMVQFGEPLIIFIAANINENIFEDAELKAFYMDIVKRHQAGEDVSAEHYAHREAPYPQLLGDILMERYSASERQEEKTGIAAIRDKDPLRTAQFAIKPFKIHFLKTKLQQISDSIKKSTDEQERIKLTGTQKKIKRELTLLEQSSPEELFPVVDEKGKNVQEPVFEYKMKSRNE